jgi:ParB family chromosome partitioning protein
MALLSDFFQHSENLPRIVELDHAAIIPNPDQPRTVFDQEKLQELAASIEARGLIHPITVKSLGEGRYMVVAGERRFRAFGLLGRSTIPAIISEGDTDELALIENVQRENLHPIDEFEAVVRLVDKHGYKHDEAGRVLGKNRVTITELLSLAAIPPALRQTARQDERVTKSFLIELAREKTPEAQLALWDATRSRGTVRAVRKARSEPGQMQEPVAAATALRAGRRFARVLSALPASDQSYAVKLKELTDQIVVILDTFELHKTEPVTTAEAANLPL